MSAPNANSPKELTIGGSIEIEIESGIVSTFSAGGRQRVPFSNPVGFVAVNGQIRFADKSEAWAILCIDENAAGELHDYGVFVPDGDSVDVVFADDFEDDFVGNTEEEVAAHINDDSWQTRFSSAIGKKPKDVWPFSYRYDTPLIIGEDGWFHVVDDEIRTDLLSARDRLGRIEEARKALQTSLGIEDGEVGWSEILKLGAIAKQIGLSNKAPRARIVEPRLKVIGSRLRKVYGGYKVLVAPMQEPYRSRFS